MFLEFKEMPKTARVWVYQSSRTFTADEFSKITLKLQNFMSDWNNHGEGLKASFTIKYNQFIVLAVDENHKSASGCSIDSSVKIIRDLETEFHLNLMDKLTISFKNGENINLVSMTNFKKYANENKITKDTVVFNNLVDTIEKFDNSWETKAINSWHARFLN
jgi:hypothetical protein